MPARDVVTRELAELFGVLSHPQRIRIVEELRDGPKDVNTLAEALGCSHSRVSQHLANLRRHHLVEPQRDGRHAYYHLTKPDLAVWLLEGLTFIEAQLTHNREIQAAVQQVRDLWMDTAEEAKT